MTTLHIRNAFCVHNLDCSTRTSHEGVAVPITPVCVPRPFEKHVNQGLPAWSIDVFSSRAEMQNAPDRGAHGGAYSIGGVPVTSRNYCRLESTDILQTSSLPVQQNGQSPC